MKGSVEDSAIIMGLVFAVMLMGLTFMNGCGKSGEEGPAATTPEHDTAIMAEETSGALAVEQKTCPVMGGPIDKNIFTEYKGKKVYFCCPACVDTFKADPEKYLAKLPQFKE